MELSLFLAKVIGICFLIFSISLIIAKANYRLIISDLIAHPAMVMLAGTMNLVLGILIVVSHNVWQSDWTVIITLVGWLLLIRGIIWTTFPGFLIRKLTRAADRGGVLYIASLVIFLLGVTLCYFGFYQG